MLEFNSEKHEYRLNGVIVPSVTQIIGFLDDYSGISKDTMEHAAQRGNAVHLATALYDQDNLDEQSIDSVIRPYLDGWIKFKKESGFIPTTIEQRVFCAKYLYAGTLDRLGLISAAQWVLDIKTTSKLMPSSGPQTWGYANCIDSKSPVRRGVVLLKSDGSYLFDEKKDQSDKTVFMSALNLYNWKRGLK